MFMDMLARQAADYIERKYLEEVTQQRTEELEAAREQNDVLLRELQHRCNNLLSVVQMLVQRTLSDATSGAATLDEAKPKLLGRLRALAHSTSQLAKSDWAGVSLLELVRVTTETFSTRIETQGDEIVIAGKDAQNIALALHELATNAAKYGALTTPEGKISVLQILAPAARHR
jgi:two-component sensor histidine kinase